MTEKRSFVLLAAQEEFKSNPNIVLTPQVSRVWFRWNDYLATTPLSRLPDTKFSTEEKMVGAAGVHSILFHGEIPKEWPADIGAVLLCLVADTEFVSSGTWAYEAALNAKQIDPQGQSKVNPGLDKVRGELGLKLAEVISQAQRSGDTNVDALPLVIAKQLTNNEDLQGKLAEFIATLQAGNLANQYLQFTSYFLRLSVKSTEIVSAHYKQNSNVIQGWADLAQLKVPTEVHNGKITVLGQRLALYREQIAVGLIFASTNATLAGELKRWFGSRAEFYGLSLCNTIASISKKFHPMDAMRHLADSRTQRTYAEILGAFAIYGCCSKLAMEMKFLTSLGVTTAMTENDARFGRYARCISTRYLSWLTFNADKSVSGALLGFASVVDSSVTTKNVEVTQMDLNLGVNVAYALIEKAGEQDEFVSDVHVAQLKKAGIRHGLAPLPEDDSSTTAADKVPDNFFMQFK